MRIGTYHNYVLHDFDSPLLTKSRYLFLLGSQEGAMESKSRNEIGDEDLCRERWFAIPRARAVPG